MVQCKQGMASNGKELKKKKMAEKIGKIWILSLKYNNLKETRSLSIIRYKWQKMSNSTIFWEAEFRFLRNIQVYTLRNISTSGNDAKYFKVDNLFKSKHFTTKNIHDDQEKAHDSCQISVL